MFERLRKYRSERQAKKEEEYLIKRAEFLTCAYNLDEMHLNTGWTNAEFNSFVNEIREQFREKPLKLIQTSFVLWEFVNEHVMEVSRRKGYVSYFRLSQKGREEIEPIILEERNLWERKN